jgi:hypothetical protein
VSTVKGRPRLRTIGHQHGGSVQNYAEERRQVTLVNYVSYDVLFLSILTPDFVDKALPLVVTYMHERIKDIKGDRGQNRARWFHLYKLER